MTAAELAIIIRARDQASKALKGLGKTVGQVQRSFRQFGSTFGVNILSVGLAGISGMVAKVGLDFNMMRENAEVAFTSMLGSAEAAQAHLDELQAFAERTPFEFPDLLQASRRMLAFGWQSDKVLPTLEAIGNAVAAQGGGSEMIDRVTLAFGQMLAKGKASSQEMMQLTEAGIPAWEILAEELGTTIPRAMKAVERGRIPAQRALEALEKGIQKRFAGMMTQQATTTAGAISNIKDITRYFLADIMKPVFLKLRDILRDVASWLALIRTRFRALPDPIKNMLTFIGTLLLVATPLLLALSGLGGALQGLQVIFGILGTIVAGLAALFGVPVGVIIGLLAAIGVAIVLLSALWNTNWGAIGKTVTDILGQIGSAISAAWSWIVDQFNWLTGEAGRIISSAWTGIAGWFSWLASEAGRIISGAWQAVAGWFGWLGGEAKRLIGEAWASVAQSFSWLTGEAGRIISEGWQGIAGWFSWLASEAGRLISEAWNNVIGSFGWLKDEANRIIGEGWAGVVGWFSWLGGETNRIIDEAWTRIAGSFYWLYYEADRIIGEAWNDVKGWFEWLRDQGLSVIDKLVNGVKDKFDWMVSKIREAWDSVQDIIDSIREALEGLGKLFGVGGAPPAGGGAGGTPFGPGAGLGGAAAGFLPVGAGVGSGLVVNVHITGPVYGVENLEDLVVDAVTRAQRRGRI